jgi:fumarate hydratase subunit beta
VISTALDGFKEVRPPLSAADVEELKAGDRVRITGVLYTARDAAHGRLLPLMDAGKPLPIDVKGQIIYYTGPSPARPGHVVGSIGPTTGGRMDKFTPKLLALGLKGTIGKGARSQPVKDALREHKAAYFGATGGAGAVLSAFVKKLEIVANRRNAAPRSPGSSRRIWRRVALASFPAEPVPRGCGLRRNP